MPLPMPTSVPTTPNNPCAPPNDAGRDNGLTNENPPLWEMNRPPHSKKRANVCIATLNVNRATAPTHHMDLKDKWAAIYKTMKSE